jgi:hypothetical protein
VGQLVGDDDHDVGLREQSRLCAGMVVGDRVGSMATSLVHEGSVHLEHEDGATAPGGVEAIGVSQRAAFVHHVDSIGEFGEFGERPHLGGKRPFGRASGHRGHVVAEIEQSGGDTAQVLGCALRRAGRDPAVGADLEEADRTAHAAVSAASIVSTRSRIVLERSNRSASRSGPAVDMAVQRTSSSMISAIDAATATGSPQPTSNPWTP